MCGHSDCAWCLGCKENARRGGTCFFVTRPLSAAEADAAIEAFNGKEFQDSVIRVTISHRKSAYNKTPGQYLGPRSVSSKYGGGGGGGGDGGSGD